MLPFRDNLPRCCEQSHIWKGVVFFGSKHEEVEALFDWEGYHHSHRSSALAIPLVVNQALASMSFQMDGIPPVVSLGNNIQEWHQHKVADMLSRPPISTSIVFQNSSLYFESYVE